MVLLSQVQKAFVDGSKKIEETGCLCERWQELALKEIRTSEKKS